MGETLNQTIERELSSVPQKIDLSLNRLLHLLSKLGNPHQKLPPTFHVAGTNGKGSTVAFLRAILEAQGLKVHTFTSPHLVHYAERIRLCGEQVDEQLLLTTIQTVKAADKTIQATVFELITAAAFVLFAGTPADALILEVGLGGEFDATNVIEKPAVSIITPISYDHKEFLGDTLTSIAKAKAGIIKTATPVVSAAQPPEVQDVLERYAQKNRTRVYFGSEHWHIQANAGQLEYEDENTLLHLEKPQKLQGIHQYDNAGLAVAALKHCSSFDISDEAIRKGILNASWPARLQNITKGKLRALLPDHFELWLDGAHNEAGAQVAALFMAQREDQLSKPLHLIVGMLSNKDADKFMSVFADLCQIVWCVPIPSSPNAYSTTQLVHCALNHGINAVPCMNVEEALRLIAKNKDARVLITGSLYLAGDVLFINETPPK